MFKSAIAFIVFAFTANFAVAQTNENDRCLAKRSGCVWVPPNGQYTPQKARDMTEPLTPQKHKWYIDPGVSALLGKAQDLSLNLTKSGNCDATGNMRSRREDNNRFLCQIVERKDGASFKVMLQYPPPGVANKSLYAIHRNGEVIAGIGPGGKGKLANAPTAAPAKGDSQAKDETSPLEKAAAKEAAPLDRTVIDVIKDLGGNGRLPSLPKF